MSGPADEAGIEVRCDCPVCAAAKLARANAQLTLKLNRAQLDYSLLTGEVRRLKAELEALSKRHSAVLDERDALRKGNATLIEERDRFGAESALAALEAEREHAVGHAEISGRYQRIVDDVRKAVGFAG